MFTLNKYKIRHAMAAKKMTAAELARRADLPATAFDNLEYGSPMKFRDFEPILKIAKVLNVEPFEMLA